MITLHNIYKAYEGKTVLEDVCFSFPKGKLSIILAPSGTGKSTLFRLLMGLETPDSGKVCGLENQRISVVFQEDRLLPYLDAVQNIRLPSIGKKALPTHAQIEKSMQEIGLTACQNKTVEELSGGMKRRVAILRALFTPCDVLLLDEPFKGLDEVTKLRTMQYVKREIEGKTTLMITHDKNEVEYMKAKQVVTL